MSTLNLSDTDRARIDALRDALDRCQNDMGEICSTVLVSCTEAARLLGRTKTTVSNMLRDGRLKKTTIGDSTGILLSDVREQAAEMR